MLALGRIMLPAALAWLAVTDASVAQVALFCRPDHSPRYQSGWCDFGSPVSLTRGERLRLVVGGTASRVIVRLLPAGGDATTPVGAIPTAYPVPPSRELDLTLPADVRDITSISVHGGRNPWGLFPLGASNGPATLAGVWRVPADARLSP